MSSGTVNLITLNVRIVDADTVDVQAIAVRIRDGLLQITAPPAADPGGPPVALAEMTVAAAQGLIESLTKGIAEAAGSTFEAIG